VNEQHVFCFLSLVENQNHRLDAGAEEKFFRQSNHGFQCVFFNQRLANAAFATATEQHAMWCNRAYLAAAFYRRFDHVADEGIIALALRWHTAMESVKLVRFRR